MIAENKLKKYRNLCSLTQEELSESSGISIRTIQRIEKGLSAGSPYSIKALAKTLNIKNTELISYKTYPKFYVKDDISTLKLMNFSVLTILFFPFGNIILPYFIFLKNKKENKMISIHGRKILSFQILSILILPFLMIFMFLLIGHGNGSFPLGVFVPYIIYLAVNVFITILNAININKEKEILKFVPNIL